MGRLTVHITRSERRQRTMSARRVGDRLEVRVPAHLGEAETRRFVEKMVRRFELDARRAQLNTGGDLSRRALELSRRYFDGRLAPASVSYATDQNRVFGSCSLRSRAIRVSHRLAEMPPWVRDYVLVHELAHLQEPDHSPRFWRLVNRYPLAERARGYLMATGLDAVGTGADSADIVDITD